MVWYGMVWYSSVTSNTNKTDSVVYTVFSLSWSHLGLECYCLHLVLASMITALVLLLSLHSWSCVSRTRQFKTPDNWRDATFNTHCHHHLVDVQWLCHLIHLHSFLSHLFSACQVAHYLPDNLPDWASPGNWLGPEGHTDFKNPVDDPSLSLWFSFKVVQWWRRDYVFA